MATKFKGTCEFCGEGTQPGRDFAARNGSSWIAVCASCSVSITEQVKGAVRRLQAMVSAAGIDPSVVQPLLPTGEALAAAMQPGADETAAYDVLGKLINAVLYVKLAGAKADPIVDGLQAVINNAQATPKDRTVAADMAAAAARYGSLTANQASYAKAIIARYDGTAAPAAASTDIVEGGYYTVAGDLYKVVKAKAGHLYAMVLLTPAQGHKHVWEFTKGGIALVRSTGVRITAEQAGALGKLSHHCVFCNRALTDDADGRSIDVGYGPVCADKHGLPWG